MKTMRNLFITIILFAIIYSGAWLYMSMEIKSTIKQFYNIDGPAQGYKFLGDSPTTSGFPFAPTINYKKGFRLNDSIIQFEDLTVKGFPIPHLPLKITADKIAIQNLPNLQLYEVDKLETTIAIPKYVPQQFTKTYLSPWQQDIGEVKFKSIMLDKNGMVINGKGTLGLDENLQPTLNLDSKLKDYAKLIHFLSVETSELKPIPAAIAMGVMNNMAETDPETGEKFVEIDVKIKDQKLYAGPINAMRLPTIVWPN